MIYTDLRAGQLVTYYCKPDQLVSLRQLGEMHGVHVWLCCTGCLSEVPQVVETEARRCLSPGLVCS